MYTLISQKTAYSCYLPERIYKYVYVAIKSFVGVVGLNVTLHKSEQIGCEKLAKFDAKILVVSEKSCTFVAEIIINHLND